MPGLTVIVASADPERFHAALSVAATNAALGRRSRIFLQGQAARLLKSIAEAPGDQGRPSLNELLVEGMALGVEVSACQSGLAIAGLGADRLPAGVTTSGLVEILSSCGDDQLLMA